MGIVFWPSVINFGNNGLSVFARFVSGFADLKVVFEGLDIIVGTMCFQLVDSAICLGNNFSACYRCLLAIRII